MDDWLFGNIIVVIIIVLIIWSIIEYAVYTLRPKDPDAVNPGTWKLFVALFTGSALLETCLMLVWLEVFRKYHRNPSTIGHAVNIVYVASVLLKLFTIAFVVARYCFGADPSLSMLSSYTISPRWILALLLFRLVFMISIVFKLRNRIRSA